MGSNLVAGVFERGGARHGHTTGHVTSIGHVTAVATGIFTVATSIVAREVGERQRDRVLLDPLPNGVSKSTSVDCEGLHQLTFD